MASSVKPLTDSWRGSGGKLISCEINHEYLKTRLDCARGFRANLELTHRYG